ncbi:MAG: adenylate/guanylate cyclase domain-containing protein [Anaerolineales bacterium]
MSTQSNGLFPYLPAMVLSQIAETPTFPKEPTTEYFKAAALFADISGFTSLTEKLAAHGPQGVEMLSRVLNEYFGRLTDQITQHGGDIVNFAGDSLLAVWKVDNSNERESLTQIIAQCALRLQKEASDYDSGIDAKLTMRIGIGMGDARAYYLGGFKERWEFVLTGSAIEEAHAAEKNAEPGDIIISQSIWELIKNDRGVQGSNVKGHVRLVNIPLTKFSTPANPPVLAEDSEASLKSFISPAIQSWLAAEQIEWLAELRRVTTLFINLKNFNSETSLEHGAKIIRAIQEATDHFEGHLNEIGMDEKGASPLVTFGVHPLAHEDDPLRGVMTAQEISKRLTELGQPHSIGITTGRVFCGVIGGANRLEYAILGDAVNTAARFMQAAASSAYSIPILCDATTQQSASSKLRFSSLEPIQLKGKSEAVLAFHPVRDVDVSRQTHHNTSFVGRATEKQILQEELLQAIKDGNARVVILEGEAGIGKSRLVEYLQEKAEEFGATYFACTGDAVEKNTSYFGWRNVFRQLLGVETAKDINERKNILLTRLSESWRERAALLNPILGMDFEEPYFVEEMSGEVRAENLRALFIELLQEEAKNKTLVITFEDAHWQDSASWALTLEVSRLVKPLLLVITTRSLDDPLPPQYQSLLTQKFAQRMALSPLLPDEAIQLVKQRLNVNDLPEDMANLIRSKAEGNPFFSEELAYSLRDSGLIEIAGNTCHIVKGVDLKSFSFPDTVQGIVTSRIDRLMPQEQLCIKVASVIGRIFTYQVLNDIHPIQNDRQYLKRYLEKLEKLDLIPLESVSPELTYIFKHAITQDVAYNLMLFGQRQELHRTIASWYEKNFANDLTPFYPALAHHWRYSGNHEKAIYYLEAAAQQSLDNFANREAVDFLNLIFQMDTQKPTADSFRKAIWHRKLGQAYKGLGNMETSASHLKDALRSMGYSIPKSQLGWGLDLVGQLLRRALLPTHKISGNARQKSQLQEAIMTYESLSEIYYYAIDLPPFLACLLHLINSVDRVGGSAEMARSYSVTAFVAGLIPLHGIAKRYEKYSLEIINSLGQFEDLAFALSALSLYNMGVGNFQQALRNMTRAVESVNFLNNRPRMAEVFTTMAQVYQRLGQYKESHNYFERAYQAGLRAENPQHQVWGLNGKAGILLYQGGMDHAHQAVDLINASIPLLVGSTDHTEDIRAYGMIGIARLRLGQPELALEAADKGLHFIATTAPTAHDALEGFAGVTETYLHLLEADPTNKELKKKTRKALQGLLKCGNLFRIAMPRYLCYQGWYEWLTGKKHKAAISWEKGLKLANQLEMKYEAARLHFESGRHASSQPYLQKAAEGFENLGAKYDLTQALNALKKQ